MRSEGRVPGMWNLALMIKKKKLYIAQKLNKNEKIFKQMINKILCSKYSGCAVRSAHGIRVLKFLALRTAQYNLIN